MHRDEGGYGLTLSGDRPTRVQTVKVVFLHVDTSQVKIEKSQLNLTRLGEQATEQE